MDVPALELVKIISELGVLPGALVYGIRWFAKRDARLERDRRDRDEGARAEAASREERQSEEASRREKKCEERNESLAARVQQLEDRQHDQLTKLTERTLADLAQTVLLHKAIMRREGMSEAEIAAVTPPEPLPIIDQAPRRRPTANH